MSFPSQQDNPTGLHLRYIVTKANGQPVDATADYLVFRIDEGGSDPIHIAAGRAAGLTYASAISSHLPQVAADIRARIPFSKAVDSVAQAKKELLASIEHAAHSPGWNRALKRELEALCAAYESQPATPAPAEEAAPASHVLVPLVATEELLASMAERHNHDYGLWDAEKQAGARASMKQVHEEVVGTGFYTYPAAGSLPAVGAGPTDFRQAICELENLGGLCHEDGRQQDGNNYYAAANCLRATLAAVSPIEGGPAALSEAAKLAHVAQHGEAVIAVWRVQEAIADCKAVAEKEFTNRPGADWHAFVNGQLTAFRELSDELAPDFASAASASTVGGAAEKLDAYRALVASVVDSQSAPDAVKAWLKGVSDKIDGPASPVAGDKQAAPADWLPIYPGCKLPPLNPEWGEWVALLNNYGEAALQPRYGRLCGGDEGGLFWHLDNQEAWAFENFTHYALLAARPSAHETVNRKALAEAAAPTVKGDQPSA